MRLLEKGAFTKENLVDDPSLFNKETEESDEDDSDFDEKDTCIKLKKKVTIGEEPVSDHEEISDEEESEIDEEVSDDDYESFEDEDCV